MPDYAPMVSASWPKLCQHTYFKLLQVKIILMSSFHKLVGTKLFLKGYSIPLTFHLFDFNTEEVDEN